MVTIIAWNVRDTDALRHEYGPFVYVQVPYDTLRVSLPDADGVDETLATYDPICQAHRHSELSSVEDGWVFAGGYIASDFTITALPTGEHA